MKGYVALTTVLIMVPLLLLTGIDSVYNNLTTLIVGRMNYDNQILKIDAETCLEESICRIKRSVNYTGQFNVAMETWSCTITVTNKDGEPGVKIVDVQAIDENNIKVHLTKQLNTNSNPFELSNI